MAKHSEEVKVRRRLNKLVGSEKSVTYDDVLRIMTLDIIEENRLRDNLKDVWESPHSKEKYEIISSINGAIDRCVKRIYAAIKILDLKPSDSESEEVNKFDLAMSELAGGNNDGT